MIRHAVCFAFIVALSAGGARAAEAPAASDDAVLQAAIRAGRAIPYGSGLRLVLTSGRHLTMSNDARGCPIDERILDDGHCYRYVLLRDLPAQHAFIVNEIYCEGDSLLLIDDRTGRQTGLGGLPVFSPDGTRFLVEPDDEDGGTDNNLEIWRRDGDGAEIEWAHPGKQVQIEAPALKDGYRARVTDWSAKDDITLAFTGGGHSWTGHLTRGPKGWTLSADWPKS